MYLNFRLRMSSKASSLRIYRKISLNINSSTQVDIFRQGWRKRNKYDKYETSFKRHNFHIIINQSSFRCKYIFFQFLPARKRKYSKKSHESHDFNQELNFIHQNATRTDEFNCSNIWNLKFKLSCKRKTSM